MENDFTLANWTKVGTQTVTNNGSTITQSGGNGTFNNYYYYNSYYTCLERLKIEATVTVNSSGATDYGVGIGLKSSSSDSTKDAILHFVTYTGSFKGKLYLWFDDKVTPSLVSTSNLSFSNGDSIKLTLERSYNTFTLTAENLTTPSSISQSYTITGNFVPPQGTPRLPNNSSPCIWSFGGSQVITSFSLSSVETTNANILCVGDSKTQGYFSGSLSNRFSNLLGATNNSGAYDRTLEVTSRLNEIILLNPVNVVLFIGCNDIRTSYGSWQTNLTTINNTLSAAGITVWNCLPAPEDAIDLTSLKNWIQSNLPNVIDLWTPFLDGVSGLAATYDPGDGIHLNSAAQSVVASQITNAVY